MKCQRNEHAERGIHKSRVSSQVITLPIAKSNIRNKSSQVNTLPKAKSKTRSKQNKDMQKFSSVYSERGAPLPVLTSGGEWVGVRACKNATRVPWQEHAHSLPYVNLTLLNARCAYAFRGPISKRKEYIRIFRRREHQKSRSPPGSGLRELTPQHHSFRHLCPWPLLAPP